MINWDESKARHSTEWSINRERGGGSAGKHEVQQATYSQRAFPSTGQHLRSTPKHLEWRCGGVAMPSLCRQRCKPFYPTGRQTRSRNALASCARYDVSQGMAASNLGNAMRIQRSSCSGVRRMSSELGIRLSKSPTALPSASARTAIFFGPRRTCAFTHAAPTFV